MLKFSTTTIVAALASILAVSGAPSEKYLQKVSDPRYAAALVSQHIKLNAASEGLDNTSSISSSSISSISSINTLRGVGEECVPVELGDIEHSEEAMAELMAIFIELLSAEEGQPLVIDYSNAEKATEELFAACTKAGGDNYLMSMKSEGCDTLNGVEVEGETSGVDVSDDVDASVSMELKNVPTCLGNCPDAQKFVDALTDMDPTCEGALTIKSSASAIAGNVFLGASALVATFTMLMM